MPGSGGWLQSTISVGRSRSCPSFSSSHSSRYFSSSQVNAAVVTLSAIPASSAYICLLLLPVMRSLLLKARHRLVLCLLADSKPWFARRLIRQHDDSGNPYSHKTYIYQRPRRTLALILLSTNLELQSTSLRFPNQHTLISCTTDNSQRAEGQACGRSWRSRQQQPVEPSGQRQGRLRAPGVNRNDPFTFTRSISEYWELISP